MSLQVRYDPSDPNISLLADYKDIRFAGLTVSQDLKMPARLSTETDLRIEALFPSGLRSEAAELLLHQCGNNLPLLEKLNEIELERFRFAALKLSAGNIDKLKKQSRWRKQIGATFSYLRDLGTSMHTNRGFQIVPNSPVAEARREYRRLRRS